MPKWITAVFVFFLSTTLLTAKAITVEDIINKHIEATRLKQSAMGSVMQAELLHHYAEKGLKAGLEGLKSVEGKICYDISLQNKAGVSIHYLIDAKNWYIIRKYIKPESEEEQPPVTASSRSFIFHQ